MYVVVEIERQIEEYISTISMLQKYIKNLKKFQKTDSVNSVQRKEIGIEIYKAQDFIALLANRLAGAYLYLTFDENEYINTSE